jgi:hypothetical protein
VASAPNDNPLTTDFADHADDEAVEPKFGGCGMHRALQRVSEQVIASSFAGARMVAMPGSGENPEPRQQLRFEISPGRGVGIQGGQPRQVPGTFFSKFLEALQVRQKSKLFFSNFQMSNDVQIWIDRHGVSISKRGAQLRQIPDLFFRNPPPTNRLSNLISRQRVV